MREEKESYEKTYLQSLDMETFSHQSKQKARKTAPERHKQRVIMEDNTRKVAKEGRHRDKQIIKLHLLQQ